MTGVQTCALPISGSLCSQTAAKEAQLGLRTTNSMPLIATNSASDYDVGGFPGNFYKGSTGGFGNATSLDLPTATAYGNINFVVGGRCYEVITTEYETGSTYTPDALLKASTGTDGKFDVLATFDGTAQCVGQVSRGVLDMNDRVQAGQTAPLAFWTRSDLAHS